MNILCLVESFWPDRAGGISKSLLPEVEGLTDLGCHVVVASRRLLAESPTYESRDGYSLYRYFSPSLNSPFYRLYPLFNLYILPRLLTELSLQSEFDIAYIHNPFQAVAIQKTLPALPRTYVYHASIYKEIELDAARGKYGWQLALAKGINRWVAMMEYKALTNADRIIVRSQFMKRDLLELYPKLDPVKVVEIPLGVDTGRFSSAPNRELLRERLSIPRNRPVLLTVRRLVARMGLENLIEAIALLRQRFPDLLLLIGGKGYLAETLQAKIQQCNLTGWVEMLGFIPEEKLPSYYAAADLFVLPTLDYEGFGLVTVEALACGTPVIATPVGASPEILKPLGEHFLFADKTPEAIATGISYWLKQGLDKPMIREQCRTYCIERFSKQQICYSLWDTLRTTISQHSPRPS